jgi:Fic family protein
MRIKQKELIDLFKEFNELDIQNQIDYQKFYLYSIITHSTAIEGSTVTEVENQLLFDQGIPAAKRSMTEQFMNLDLKAAYDKSMEFAAQKKEITIQMLKELSALVMKNTGSVYNTISGSFDSSKGDLRLVNVSAGVGGKSYLSYTKVPDYLEKFCTWLNKERKQLSKDDIYAAYKLSFEAHYRLVTIHPWVDGNGRMSRLVMNQLQFEQNILPTIVYTDHKADYITALASSRDNDDSSIFCGFMFDELAAYLKSSIAEFRKSLNGTVKTDSGTVNGTVKDKENAIIKAIRNNPQITQSELSEELGIALRTLKRYMKTLADDGKIERVGSDKNGMWKVRK